MGGKGGVLTISFKITQYLKVKRAIRDGGVPACDEVSFNFWLGSTVSPLVPFRVLSDVVNVIGEGGLVLDICENIIGARVNDDNRELLNF